MYIDIINNLDSLTDEYLVVGVSAGPDSMALLHLLTNNTKKKIVCAHINHNIRKESNEEEKYLNNYCKHNNIIFESMKITNYCKNNFENEAREKRYMFYEEILKKYHSHTLLLAHHGDDLIETIIMKIIRGSNLEGYAGIKTYSYQKDYVIIRPLLSITKDDILKYNKDNNITYYIDKTNNDINYLRNRIRKNILPLLKEEKKDIHLNFLKYSDTLQAYYNYVEDITKEKINTTYKNNIINIDIFNKEHPFMKRNIVFYILSNIYNNESSIIKDKHIDDIIKLCNSNKPNAITSLPKEYHVRKEYQNIYIEKSTNDNLQYKLLLEDKIKIDDLIIEKVNKRDSDDNYVCRLNSKIIKLPLYLRNRKNGDCISLLGTNGKKKIKDIFIDEKVPIKKRDNYPILVDDNDTILWIPGLKKSKYCFKKNENYDIILYSYKESEEQNESEKEN